jgi:uncharacterized membrane protein YagU involved in acid resistance
VLLGGCAAATIDIVYAFVRNAGFGKTPEWVLQSVASGFLGMGAFESGMPGAFLGLVSHYSILIIAAFVYLQAANRVPALRTQALACGAAFGVLVYLFMNFVVLPLSAFPFTLSYTPMRLVEGFASHAVFVGIPIAIAIRWLVHPDRRAPEETP